MAFPLFYPSVMKGKHEEREGEVKALSVPYTTLNPQCLDLLQDMGVCVYVLINWSFKLKNRKSNCFWVSAH